jgi:hypothetical protein
MQRYRHRICALLAAAMLLLVSISCTSAGCLLRMALFGSHGAGESHSCCAMTRGQQGDRDSSGHQNRHQCPLCRGPLFVGGSAKSHHDLHVKVHSPVLFAAALAGPAAPICPAHGAAFVHPTESFHDSTLLGLHCALLT